MGFWRTEDMSKVAYLPFDMGSTQETINREMQSLWLVKMRFFLFRILYAPQESQEEGFFSCLVLYGCTTAGVRWVGEGVAVRGHSDDSKHAPKIDDFFSFFFPFTFLFVQITLFHVPNLKGNHLKI
jgi:hypothetical protein